MSVKKAKSAEPAVRWISSQKKTENEQPSADHRRGSRSVDF